MELMTLSFQVERGTFRQVNRSLLVSLTIVIQFNTEHIITNVQGKLYFGNPKRNSWFQY
ncbi:unnamed protein product, partial [Schistosoma rodhaini]